MQWIACCNRVAAMFQTDGRGLDWARWLEMHLLYASKVAYVESSTQEKSSRI
jgi:hypothetical protein